MAQGVFAITEQRDGELRKVSFEAVSEGRRVADGLGADLTAVVLGSGIEGLAEELKKYGPDKILVADDAALADYTTDAYTNVLAELIQSSD
ncbi:MAG: electron transfer flavoprotein subunit alpha/FixB family protein, partial [Desulfobacterales bacterium]|nr:electron transfer flavoprotein subunit alpha/FixB family protein [Desulfobacterales bacterium]MCK5486438.1 electron transfer flavoprotein subunit alpha/FixB family protein [Desulfobacterales bacterium]